MRYAEKYTIDFLAEKTGVAVEILAKQSPAALTDLAAALGQFLTAQHKLNCKVLVLKAGS